LERIGWESPAVNGNCVCTTGCPNYNRDFSDDQGSRIIAETSSTFNLVFGADPDDFVQLFRSNPYTRFGVFVPLVKGLSQPLA